MNFGNIILFIFLVIYYLMQRIKIDSATRKLFYGYEVLNKTYCVLKKNLIMSLEYKRRNKTS